MLIITRLEEVGISKLLTGPSNILCGPILITKCELAFLHPLQQICNIYLSGLGRGFLFETMTQSFVMT